MILTIIPILCLSLLITVPVYVHDTVFSLLESFVEEAFSDEKLLYKNYLTQFKKSVASNEFETRFSYFKNSLKAIARQNRLSRAKFGLTKFSDWSEKEFAATLLPIVDNCEKMHRNSCLHEPRVSRISKLPGRLDWRRRGAVGPGLDQKTCPVCWAISIIGVMESMAFIRYNHFSRLSIQEVVDCSFSRRSDKTGCRTGRPVVYALQHLCQYQLPIATEEDYPLTLTDKDCDSSFKGIRKLKSFWNYCNMHKNETKILELLNEGPVIALVNGMLLQNYIEGIITINCETTENEVNHAVQLVGYDTTGEVPYYILRNSWGADWGEGGYALLAAEGNQCGVAFSIASLDVQ